MASPRSPAIDCGPPVDYSFRDLKTVPELVFEEAVSGTPSKPPIKTDMSWSDYLDGLASKASDSPPQPGVRYNSNSLRLCNNHLVNLKELKKVMHHVLDKPSELVWLDASCNQFSGVDDIIMEFPKLQVLYLHGNQIRHMSDIAKLAKLEHLSKLTLHGNPISEQKNYKLYVAAHLPKLRSLDFSTITKLDRDKTDNWFRGYQKMHAEK